MIRTILNYDTYLIIPDELEEWQGHEFASDESKIKIETFFFSLDGRRELWNLNLT